MWRSLSTISSSITILGLWLCLGNVALAQESKPASKPETAPAKKSETRKSRFEKHWVVIMELGDKTDLEKDRIVELKKQHLRYMDKLEESGELRISSGFRVHHDERHRELAFYSTDLKKAKVEELANASPIVKAGYWKPFVYMWMTRSGVVKIGDD